MRVTLIKPNIGRSEHSLYVDEGRMEPLQLGVLAALTPAEVEVELYDDRMERIPYDRPADLVAITAETYTARRAYEIAAEYRRRSVPVIIGGFQPTLLPEETQQYADSIFVGDAEMGWAKVINDARAGRLQKQYIAAPGRPQPGVLTRRDLFKGKGYLPISLIQFSRGCRFSCNFCAVSKFFGKAQFLREIDEVLQEIQSQDRKLFFFVDDNIASNQHALKELCRALIPMRIRWVSQGSIDMTRDAELMHLMVESGCLGHVIGFESINRDSLKEAKKSPNLRQFAHYEPQIKILRDYGLQTWAAFTLGYDHDTYDSIMNTLQFALDHRFTFAAFNILMPYPNTPLYERLQQEGRLLYDGKWWLHPEYRFNNAAFIPRHMSPEELTEVCHVARTKFNGVPALFKRFMDVRTNMRSLVRMFTYWRYNPVFRKEVFKKHGMRFGLN